VEIRESLIAPDNHSYSPDESKVYQNLLIRQGVLFKIVQKLWISCLKWARAPLKTPLRQPSV